MYEKVRKILYTLRLFQHGTVDHEKPKVCDNRAKTGASSIYIQNTLEYFIDFYTDCLDIFIKYL